MSATQMPPIRHKLPNDAHQWHTQSDQHQSANSWPPQGPGLVLMPTETCCGEEYCRDYNLDSRYSDISYIIFRCDFSYLSPNCCFTHCPKLHFCWLNMETFFSLFYSQARWLSWVYHPDSHQRPFGLAAIACVCYYMQCLLCVLSLRLWPKTDNNGCLGHW